MQEFLAKFAEVAPVMLSPPNFASDFAPQTKPADASAAIPDKLTFSFYLPHATIGKEQKVGAAPPPPLHSNGSSGGAAPRSHLRPPPPRAARMHPSRGIERRLEMRANAVS